jgi:hypothetical protein
MFYSVMEEADPVFHDFCGFIWALKMCVFETLGIFNHFSSPF